MYALEYKQLYIVKEPVLANCTTQTYRWKQAAICEKAEPLEEIRAQKKHPEEWRVIPMGDDAVAEMERS